MAVITEDYVSFEVAKLLKEKGFPLPSTNFEDWVFCMYDENGGIQWGCYHPDYYCRVTLQMAMKWLREVHNINIEIYVIKKYDKKICEYTYTIMDLNFPGSDDGIDCCNKYKTYEQAGDAAIKYCLENLI